MAGRDDFVDFPFRKQNRGCKTRKGSSKKHVLSSHNCDKVCEINQLEEERFFLAPVLEVLVHGQMALLLLGTVEREHIMAHHGRNT
jgi:hypothetical protein